MPKVVALPFWLKWPFRLESPQMRCCGAFAHEGTLWSAQPSSVALQRLPQTVVFAPSGLHAMGWNGWSSNAILGVEGSHMGDDLGEMENLSVVTGL